MGKDRLDREGERGERRGAMRESGKRQAGGGKGEGRGERSDEKAESGEGAGERKKGKYMRREQQLKARGRGGQERKEQGEGRGVRKDCRRDEMRGVERLTRRGRPLSSISPLGLNPVRSSEEPSHLPSFTLFGILIS